MKLFKLCFAAAIVFMFFNLVFAENDGYKHRILKVDIDGPITPATEELLQGSIARAQDEDFIALMIRLDTPGGLAESMRNMVKDILNSEVPVIVWVDPPGARATSAGVFLVAASDHAVMSPMTTIGSASPVTMGGEEQDETMAAKIINEMLSLVRSVAKDKDRNIEWYERAVTEAANIYAEEALQKRVIDHIAVSEEDLLSQLGKKGIYVAGEEITFDSQDIYIVQFEPGIKYKILSWLLHPQIAYLLFLAGMAGLFFELSNPGAIFPGVIGSMCLVMGLYSLAVLPTNIAGILLLILGFIFIILEVNMPTFGLLTTAAIASFFFGSLFLFDAEHPYFQIPTMTIIPVVLIMTVVLLGLAYLIGRSQMAPKTHQTGLPDNTSTAKVVNWTGTHGQVKIRGEIWRAQSREYVSLQPGQDVQIEQIEGLTIYIKPV
ncbi:nodulation protein NfeD [Desulfonatronospira sp.]|uniref:NfeD family protein n=1 Tax=Desulfonatronospira sp. TaxID=1962951 RepID=UPI0025BEFB24|nr:nodulation protein NfeD [Desulfonatronospira sp.]